MLTNKQKKLNDFIIREAGLELDEMNHIVDQDTGMPIIVKDKKVKYNNGPITRLMPNEIEFDPLNNSILTGEICANYISKLQEEGEINVRSYGISNKERNTPGKGVCIADKTLSTREYILDSLKYIDLIAILNDTPTNSKDTIELKSYDLKKPKKITRRK